MHELRNETLSRFLGAPGRFAIFGSDAVGESVLDALGDAGLKPAFFLDLDRTGELRGLDVLPPEAALGLDAVVTAGSAARDMTVQLRADGFEGPVLDWTGLEGGGAAYHDEALIDAAGDTIGFARSLLQDDGSREVFDAVLAYRRSLDPGELPPAPPGAGHPALPVVEGEWVLDLGSGPDALLALAEAVGPLGRVHALSPDPAARRAIADAAADSALGARISVHALGRRRGDTADENDEATPVLASVDDFVWEVTAGRIDRVRALAPSPHTILGGASATLAEHRPRLVVALGARPADLWELPVLLKERCPGYRLHLGHPGPGATATRLYGRPPEPR